MRAPTLLELSADFQRGSYGSICQALSQVCSTGSFALGLVTEYGQRVDGPCPALEQDGERQLCGLVRRPKHYLAADRGVTVLREAVKLLIGAGSGCDEAGDEPDETFLPKARRMMDEYTRRHPRDAFTKAAATLFTGRLRGS